MHPELKFAVALIIESNGMESNSDLVWTWPDPLPIHYAGKSLETSVGSAVLNAGLFFFQERHPLQYLCSILQAYCISLEYYISVYMTCNQYCLLQLLQKIHFI